MKFADRKKGESKMEKIASGNGGDVGLGGKLCCFTDATFTNQKR